MIILNIEYKQPALVVTPNELVCALECNLKASDVFVTDVTFVPVSKVTARVEVEDVISAVRPNTCLISIMLANNETGVIMVRGEK